VALAQNRRLIPVLVGGAAMSTRSSLPEDLAGLSALQAMVLRDDTWHRDVDSLLAALGLGNSRSRQRTRMLVAGLTMLASALVVGVAVAIQLLEREPGTDRQRTVTDSTTPTTSASFDPLALLPLCPSPKARGWVSLPVPATAAPIGPSDKPVATVQVIGSHRGDSNGEILLHIPYTNRKAGSARQYWWFYELVDRGISADPFCFSDVAGVDPAGPGETSEIVVGFRATAGSAADRALHVNVGGARGRIDLPDA
jgi:hypothetical protein